VAAAVSVLGLICAVAIKEIPLRTLSGIEASRAEASAAEAATGAAAVSGAGTGASAGTATGAGEVAADRSRQAPDQAMSSGGIG